MPDLMYLLLIPILLYMCCLPRFEGFSGGTNDLKKAARSDVFWSFGLNVRNLAGESKLI